MKYAIICGSPRSGTSYITRALDAHPAVAALVDSPALMIGKGGNAGRGLQNNLQARNPRIFGKCNRRIFTENMRFPATVDGFKRAVEASIEPGVTCFVPKFTEYSFKLPVVSEGIDLAICIVRDPRDVIESQLRGHAKWRVGLIPPGPQWRRDIRAAINAGSSWMDYMLAWDEYQKTATVPCLTLRYADYPKAPEILSEALGIDPAPLRSYIDATFKHKSDWREKIPEVDAALPGTWRAMMEQYGIAP